MNTPSIVFTPRLFIIPTPRHASQPPAEIRQAFITLLAGNRAAQLAIKQAAQGQCLLVITPSRNPQANQVFHSVLATMIAWHQAQVPGEEPAPGAESATEPAAESAAAPAAAVAAAVAAAAAAPAVQVIETSPEELAEASFAAALEAAFLTS